METVCWQLNCITCLLDVLFMAIKWLTHVKTRLSVINTLYSKGNYSATLNNTKLVYWRLIGGLLHLAQRGGAWAGWCGPGRAGAPPRPLLAVPNVTAHPSTASVWVTVLIYNGPLICVFNVTIKGLTTSTVVIQMNAILKLCCRCFIFKKENVYAYLVISCKTGQMSVRASVHPSLQRQHF